MNKKTILFTILAVFTSALLVIIDIPETKASQPKEVYRVYLDGQSLGLVESKDELENYIDQEQTEIKEKYHVDKVYIPNELDIVKEITFDEETVSNEKIYNRIQNQSPFTIQGYKIFIQGVEEQNENGEIEKEPDQVLYVLDENVFLDSVYKTARTFIDEKELEAYENDTQKPIVDTGKIIENVYIQNEQMITKEKIPVDEKIYTSEDELSKYLLFGTTEEQEKYTVQEGDTIEEISFANKISPEEFLIANPSFTSANDLLFPGEVVNLGILQPQLNIVEETHVVERQTIGYNTVYEDDPNQYSGQEQVKQEGQEGIQLVTQKIKIVNGEKTNVVTIETKEEKPSVDRIIVRGTKQRNVGGGIDDGVEVPVEIGTWVWPTISPYQITSPFSYRWGKLHEAVDISGCGYGSPIKAANNGIIVYSGYNGTNGNFIYIKHSNGQYTEYAHMATRYKKAGDIVYAGDVIGTMGQTGYAFGTHLHFGLWWGHPHRSSSTPVNPLSHY